MYASQCVIWKEKLGYNQGGYVQETLFYSAQNIPNYNFDLANGLGNSVVAQ